MEKTIKVSEETYKRINAFVGRLRENRKRPVSMNYAISILLKSEKRPDIMSFAGAWSMSDAEAEKFEKDLRKMWKSWKV